MKDILVVEDQVNERQRLEKIFTEAGYTVEACESVSDAERALSASQFRMAILDIGLADKSGSLLFHDLRRLGRVSYIVIYTGNPSVHLKQRFISEGAADYIIKGSPQGQSEKLLSRIKEIIGVTLGSTVEGIKLETFLDLYVDPSSHKLFQNMDGSLVKCKSCGGASYVVTFHGLPQIPPEVTGKIKCAHCATEMDPEID